MMDSELEEIVKLIYPVEATMKHILKGSNYYYMDYGLESTFPHREGTFRCFEQAVEQ